MAVSDHPAPEPQDGDEPLYWDTPELYGQAEALNSMGVIAAPLLGGFSLAAMVLTVTITTSETRWPDAALLLFMLAAVFFVATVQFMFVARMYQASPPDFKAWWPDAEQPQRMKKLQNEQKRHAAGFRRWSGRALVNYRVAVLCLQAALTILAVPAVSHGQVSVLRWLAVAVGGVVFIAQAIWLIGNFISPERMARLLER
jgi:hypothetical protein